MVVRTKIANREWYQAYCAAMLEPDAEKMFASVEFARKAIQQRVKELSQGLTGTNNESNELNRALRFLSLLVDSSTPLQASRLTPN